MERRRGVGEGWSGVITQHTISKVRLGAQQLRCLLLFSAPKPKDSILISSSHLALDGRASASCDASCVFPSSLHILI